MASNNHLVRPAQFDNATASPKRRKIEHSKEYDSANDSGEDIFSEVATLPMEPTQIMSNPQANGFGASSYTAASSPPASSFVTQPTQLFSNVNSPARPPPVVQVQASSPFRANNSSPVRPPPAPANGHSALAADGSVKPFDFYPAAMKVTSINLDAQGPQYAGSSSEGDGSDHELKPTFGSTRKAPSISLARRESSAGSQQPPPGERVPQSPITSMKALASKYTYNGQRLDSLKKPQVSASNGFQRRPEPVKPVLDLKLEDIPPQHRGQIERMKLVCPDKPIGLLVTALAKAKGDFDKAIEECTSDDGVIELSAEEAQRLQQRRTANRAAAAPRVSIKEKWGHTQAQDSVMLSSPPAAAAAAPGRRRLVRGSNRASREETPIEIDDDTDSAAEVDDSDDERLEVEAKVLEYVNRCTVKELADIACTTEDICTLILDQRPFKNLDEVRQVSGPAPTVTKSGKKARGAKSRCIGEKVVDICVETWRGYDAVDSLIQRVEQLGRPIAESIKKWGVDIVSGSGGSGELDMTDIKFDGDENSTKDSGIGTPTDTADDADNEVKGAKRAQQLGFMKTQPKNMKEGTILKDYQIAGVNWLNLLYEKKLSCILADEMGLGKTCQVISFLAHLMTKGITGPHLVVVPSSTLENWLREFANFCPDLKVEPYYGSQKDRPMIRHALLKDRSWNVLVTTYQLATGDKMDRNFLKSLQFNVCVYDEGHMLKNSSSNRYDALIKLPAQFRLLLTGTPLQNNLQELASLLAFILPSVFEEKKDDLQSIFKYKAKTNDDESSNNALLSQQRISRARAMMTPFVLRRKKLQVLKHLPGKTSRVEYCDLTPLQKEIYHEQIATAQESIVARAAGKKPNKSTTNVMMQLRKAAIHPLLFRTHYPVEKLRKMSKEIMKEAAYRDNDSQYIFEDMEVMNDLELSRLCEKFPKTIGKHALKKDEWMNAGKVEVIEKLLVDMHKNGDRVLIFSQFTQVLDILELVLATLDLGFLRIDGSTPVDARQDLIDQYHEEQDITVFLLSTKAGGFGINLACANKVIIFDSSFNPHDDAQASDRAHRVGQTREVEVIRLVTKNTIEEQILQLANTKLALDQSISEGDDKAIEGKAEEIVAKMLLESNKKKEEEEKKKKEEEEGEEVKEEA